MKRWQINYFNEAVFNTIMALPKKLKARYVVLTERMEINGPNLGLPHTRSMQSGLFEVRVKAEEGIARAFYCTCVNHEIVILHAFIKNTQQTPRKELKIALARLQEVRNNE